jgi:hypothetical protein
MLIVSSPAGPDGSDCPECPDSPDGSDGSFDPDGPDGSFDLDGPDRSDCLDASSLVPGEGDSITLTAEVKPDLVENNSEQVFNRMLNHTLREKEVKFKIKLIRILLFYFWVNI